MAAYGGSHVCRSRRLAPALLAPHYHCASPRLSRTSRQVLADRDVTLMCDAAQLNSVDQPREERRRSRAMTTRAGRAEAACASRGRSALVRSRIRSRDGPGVEPNESFRAFFTTKPAGSGIGLVLCPQIAENHSGSLRG